MAKFKMENFGGELPAVDDRLLPENHATAAINTWLLSGRIEPIHSLLSLHTMVNPAARSFFRLPISAPGVDNMVNSHWLEFENQNVRVIRSPVTGQDDDGRYYWADGVYPKYMTGAMIATDPQPTPYKLGVPIPPIPPGVTDLDDGVSTVNEMRAYCYTWVTSLGEEGPPSFPTLHTARLDDTWVITVTAPSVAEAADRNLTKTRIYRSITSIQGVATYFFVDEIPITTLTYNDTKTDAEVSLNEQLQSLNWTEPPADLQGLISLPNGMVAGWRKNEVWLCEPYYPHAWPIQYVIAVPNNIVGLGAVGQSIIILTDGSPWSATGVDPAAMALAVIQPLEPCTARLSIVNTPNAVLYSSPNGLIQITASGAQNLTKDFMLKNQWAEKLNLNSIAASILMQGYYAYSITDSNVFQEDTFQIDAFQQKSHFGTRPGVFISMADPRVALNVLDPLDIEVQNVITDIFNGETMVLRNGVVYLVDVRGQSAYGRYKWRSKIWQTPYLQNLGAAKVYWTPPYDPTAGDTIFRMYAGDQAQLKDDGLPLRFTEKMTESGQVFRLPSGYKALYWQFEVEGYALINAIHAASSPRELREI